MKISVEAIFFVLVILHFNAFAVTDCNPVAQFSHQGQMSPHKIEFLSWFTAPTFKNAQINTINCSEKKQNLNQESYQKLQELTASARPAFVVFKKKSDVIDSICLIEVHHVDEILNRTWELKKDSCFQSGLIRATDSVSKKFFYLAENQISYLNSRMPSSSKIKKRKN